MGEVAMLRPRQIDYMIPDVDFLAEKILIQAVIPEI